MAAVKKVTRPYRRMIVPDMSREDMLMLAREWFDLYGEPPRARDWTASEVAKRPAKERKRFEQGGWPTVSQIRSNFGAFTDFLIIAGFYPRQSRPLWRSTPLSMRSYYLRQAVESLKAEIAAGRRAAVQTPAEQSNIATLRPVS